MAHNPEQGQTECAPLTDASSLGATLAEKLTFINSNKLAANRPVHVVATGSSNGGSAAHSQSGIRPATASSSTSATSSQPHWVQPSGPRRPGEGTENEEQGIISAEQQPGGGVLLRITLLSAGFVIGPAGSSVREIMRVTGVDIKSWTDSSSKSRHGTRRPCRVFVVEGDDEAVGAAVDIISAAVDRYKDLCEGRYQGQSVPRQQRVMGVEFSYQPPPRNVVPFAAALKGNITRPPVKTTPDFGNRTGPASLLPLLPGYLLPMAGPYLPGSPTTSLPFPLYTQSSRGTGYDLPEVPTTNSSDTSYPSGFDVNQLLGSSTQTSWPMPTTSVGGGFAYPPVDPASMMAYMSLMMPPPSPGQAFTAMDPNTGLGLGTIPTFPGGATLPHMSPPPPVPGTAPAGFALAQMGPLIGSPTQPMYAQAGMSMMHGVDKGMGGHPGDLSGFGGAKHMGVNAGGRMEYSDPSAGYHLASHQAAPMAIPGTTMPAMTTAPMGPAMVPSPYGGSFTAGTLCWFPPSPMAMPYATTGWKNMHQPTPARPSGGQASASPQQSPTNSLSSPSRLNPMAQPWSALDGNAHASATGPSAPPQHPSTVDPQYVAHVTTMPEGNISGSEPYPVPISNLPPVLHTLSRQATAEAPSGAPALGATTAAAPQGMSAASNTQAIPARVAPPAQIRGTSPTYIAVPAPDVSEPNALPAGDGSGLSNASTPLKLDDESLPASTPLSLGKTPKRPSASRSTGYQTCNSSMTYSPMSGTASAGSRATASATGARSNGAIRSAGSSNGQACAGPGGVGASPSRPMVSSEDPLISPSRFTRGGAGPLRNKPRSQPAMSHDSTGNSHPDAGVPKSAPNPAVLTSLPGLVEAMSTSTGRQAPAGPSQPEYAAPTAQEV